MASDAEDLYNSFYNKDTEDYVDQSTEVLGLEGNEILKCADGLDYEDGYSTDNNNTDEGQKYIDDWEGHLSCDEIKSPNGKKTIFWIPKVKEEDVPSKDQIFDTLDAGISAYYAYGRKAGFDCRLGSTRCKNNKKMYRYVICSSAGECKNATAIKKRKRKSKRTNCQAQICFKLLEDSGKYIVHDILKTHNHVLYTDATIHMSKHVRKLNFYDNSVVYNLYNLNYGGTKTHHIVDALEGGYDTLGPTCSDYKNFANALNAAIEDTDANVVVSLLEERKEMFPTFSFDHFLEDKELRGLFWADNIAKRNYHEFSDLVSFDGTYRTNKYDMIFVPFTGIDNHKRCVTFGGALLAQETIEYYTWLLEKFIDAFEKEPRLVVTDQDASICSAVATVLPNSVHRICMWHVGRKIPKYVPSKILQETDFREKFNRLIWSQCVEPITFEIEWASLIKEFKLEDNDWLKTMYNLRYKWIPVYFRDTPLSALMRTTSRSESENFFFQSFLSMTSNLLRFMCKFDLAMDRQRKHQSCNDSDDIHKKPVTETHSVLEEQAAGFYTFKMFGIVQNEIYDSIWSCSPGEISYDRNSNEVCLVLEQYMGRPDMNKSEYFHLKRRDYYVQGRSTFDYKVNVTGNNETFKCSCMLFELYGILCRHVFCVMKKKFVQHIPEKYLLRRWQKSIIRPSELKKKYSLIERGGGCEKKVRELYKVMGDCVGLIAHDNEAMDEYLNWMKEKRSIIKKNPPKKDVRTNKEKFEALSGISLNVSNDIRNPENIRTKGRKRSTKRLKGKQEIAINAATTGPKNCNYCHKKIGANEKHDKRNCPLRKEHEREKQKQKEAELEAAGVFNKTNR